MADRTTYWLTLLTGVCLSLSGALGLLRGLEDGFSNYAIGQLVVGAFGLMILGYSAYQLLRSNQDS